MKDKKSTVTKLSKYKPKFNTVTESDERKLNNLSDFALGYINKNFEKEDHYIVLERLILNLLGSDYADKLMSGKTVKDCYKEFEKFYEHLKRGLAKILFLHTALTLRKDPKKDEFLISQL